MKLFLKLWLYCYISPPSFYGILQVQLFYKLSMTAENTTDLAKCKEYYEKLSGNFIFLSKARRQNNRKRIINRMLAAKTILHFERNTNGRLATGTVMAVAVIKCDCYRVIYLCPSRDRSCTTHCTTSKWSKDTDLHLNFRKIKCSYNWEVAISVNNYDLPHESHWNSVKFYKHTSALNVYKLTS